MVDALKGFGQINAKDTQGVSVFSSLTNHMVKK